MPEPAPCPDRSWYLGFTHPRTRLAMESRTRILDALTDLGRYMTALPRRNPRLRAMIPTSAIIMLNRGRGHLARSRRLLIPVLEQSRYTNVFHCCVHKTGSQWLRT